MEEKVEEGRRIIHLELNRDRLLLI
jgi:hypothetical protein